MKTTTGIIEAPIRSAAARWIGASVVLAGLAIAAIVAARFALAETILSVAAKNPVPMALLEKAAELEPQNPQTYRALAVYEMDFAHPPDFVEARRLLDASLERGPNRVQTVIEFGRNRELAGVMDEAEIAYKRAVSMAPSSWKPQWALGNLYLRNDRLSEAVDAFAVVSDRNPDLSRLIVTTVWRATDGDVASTTRSAGTGSYGRGQLLELLSLKGNVDDTLALWTELLSANPGDASIRSYANRLAPQLLGSGRVEDAVTVWEKIEPDTPVVAGRVANAGFDDPVNEGETWPFRWMLQQNADARISVDAGRQAGKSLRVDYKLKAGESLAHARELVRLQPGARYELTVWCKTDDLVSGGLPEIAVTDPSGPQKILASVRLPMGTTPWTQYTATLQAPQSGLAAIEIRRVACDPVCPIFGTIRIDDVALTGN